MGCEWRPVGKSAWVWDARTGTVLAELEGHTANVLSAGFSPDGLQVVVANEDGSTRVSNARTGATITILNGHHATFSSDGLRVLTRGHARANALNCLGFDAVHSCMP